MADWTRAEDNYLIRYINPDYSQIVINPNAPDATDQQPGLTTDSDFPNLVTNVTEEGIEPDKLERREIKWLWPYKGMKVQLRYLDGNKTSEWGGNDKFHDHLVAIYFIDSENFNSANGGVDFPSHDNAIRTWVDGDGAAALIWYEYKDFNTSSGNLLGHGNHDFYFTKTGSSNTEPAENDYPTVTDIPFNPTVTSFYENQEPYNGTLLNKSMLNWHNALHGQQSDNSHLIFVIRLGGDLDETGGEDALNRRYYFMKLPKTAIKKVVTDPDIEYLEYGWGSGETKIKYVDYEGNEEISNPASIPSSIRDKYGHSDNDGMFEDEETTPAWYLQDFIVRIYAPTEYDRDDFPTGQYGLEGSMDWPVWSDLSAEPNLQHLHPGKEIDYMSVTNNDISFDHNDINDFRPISHVWVDIDNIGYNLQSFYDFTDPDYMYTGAPNAVKLAFDLSEQHTVIGDAYISDYQWFNYSDDIDSGYKFFVMNWDGADQGGDPTTDTDLIDEIISGGSAAYTHHDISETLSHAYSEMGTYIIQVMVYSWIKHPDEEFIMACRWKRVNIWFNLNEGSLSVIDFQDLGSTQFTTIPWPTPGAIPIISGISQDSKYYKSVDAVYEGGEFGLSDHADVNRLKSARWNDELGDHLGQIDLEQIRVFTAPYDMHELLMINQERDDNTGELLTYTYEEWHPYWDDTYWYGGYQFIDGYWQYVDSTKRFPRPTGEEDEFDDSSCIGIQYITNSPERSLRDTCVMELNTGELTRGAIFDSSGIGNIGFALGDYTVEKKSKTIKLSRDSAIDMPEISTKDKAI